MFFEPVATEFGDWVLRVLPGRAFDLAYLEDLPYLVALVELEEDPSLRVLSNLVDIDVNGATVGMPVEVVFVQRDGQSLPMFRPQGARHGRS